MILLRRRFILGIHRWAGLLSACFLLILAMTGLALNHTEFLGLDEIQVRNGFLLSRYGMATSGDVQVMRISPANALVVVRDSVYINQELAADRDRLVACWSGPDLDAVIMEDGIYLLDKAGTLVEEMDSSVMPEVPLTGAGEDPSGNLVLISANGRWWVDSDWIRFHPYTGKVEERFLDPRFVTDKDAEVLLEGIQGTGVTLYRVLLDLHSGRLLGITGRTLMDASAIAILLLVSTGIQTFFRGKRSTNTPGRR